MIIYKDDWIKYKTVPHVHYETRNDSFLQMASKYHEMGVENCLFHLSLFNRELIDVDPHDPNLTLEQKQAVAIECSQNFWYFIREVIRINVKGVDGGISYKANRGNLAMSWLYLAHIDTFLIQPRQTGKSVSTDCIMLWLIYFGTKNNSFTLITLGHLRPENIKRLKEMRDLLPKYLLAKSNKDPDNSEWIGYSKLSNVYKAVIAQGNETAANNLGRGITTATVHVDEGPFLNFIDVTIPAALNATTTARTLAEQNGTPHGNIFTTTAGRKDSREGKYYYNILSEAAIWTERFLDCKDFKDLSETIMANSRGQATEAPSVNITLSHRQLGYTDEWLRKKIAQNKNSKDAAERDYFNKWTSGNLTSPLSIALNEKVTASLREPVWTQITKQKYMINWYISKADIELNKTSTHYILGMDTSDATSTGDGMAIVFRDIRDLGVVATMNFRNTNLMNVGGLLADLLTEHRNSTLIIERNRAQALIDKLLIELPARGIDPFKRLYNTLVNDQTIRRAEFAELQAPLSSRTQEFYDSKRTSFGFWTGSNSRAILYGNTLQEAAKMTGYAVRDKTLIDQIVGLVAKNGRVDHKSGSHDDLVIAWLLSHWFAIEARHHDWYGIDKSKVMSIKEREIGYTAEEEAWMDYQGRLQDEVNDIMEQLKTATNPQIVTRLERKLVHIKSQIVDMGSEAQTIDQLLAEAAEERMVRSRTNKLNSNSLRRGMGHRPSGHRSMHAGRGFW